MNQSDDLFPPPGGTPNPHWARAFEQAADAPPPRVWEGVERQLDLDEADGILPLWQHQQGRQSMLFGRWAASVAASLVLAALGWWAWHREDALRPDAPTVATRQLTRATPPSIVPSLSENRTSPGTLAAQSIVDEQIRVEKMPLNVGKRSPAEETIAALNPARHRVAVLANSLVSNSIRQQGPSESTTVAQPALPAHGSLAPPAVPTLTQAETAADRPVLAVVPLAHRPITQRDISIDRIVWYRAEASTDVPGAVSEQFTNKKSTSRVWVSAGIATAAFDAGVMARTTANSVSYQSNALMISPNDPAAGLQSQVGQVLAVQASIGVAVGRRWTVETGVAYTAGRSDVWSPMRNATALAKSRDGGSANNLYTDLLQQATAPQPTADQMAFAPMYQAENVAAKLGASYTSTNPQVVANGYQFVQVPVQVGYELRPRRKLGLALLTGVVSNWFVRNTVADTRILDANAGVYRPVTVAGSAGMRLRYRPGKNWSASVAGTFQQSLQSLTQTEVGFRATPQQLGLSFCVDRHF